MIDNVLSNYLMTNCLQNLLLSKGIEWLAEQNYLPYMTHITQLTLGTFIDSLYVKGQVTSWEDTERETIG
jgi:hypothetical protein